MMDINNARDASRSLRLAADMLRDYAVLKDAGVVHPEAIVLAETNVRIAAETMGFRLVNAVSAAAQQAHDSMIAARRAEDRDFSLIGGGRV